MVASPKFQITELSGRRRAIELTGRALPFRPLELGGKQRVEVNYYPGNPQGVAQVLGPVEDPTTIRGFWKDKFLGDTNEKWFGSDGRTIRSCLEATELVDSIRKEGQRLEVQWGFIIRRGYIESFSTKWHNIHDVEWEITFKWDSQAGPDIFAVPREPNLPETSNILNSIRDLMRSLAQPPFPAALEYIDLFNSALQTIGQASRDVEQMAGNFMDLAFSPVDAVNNSIAALKTAAGAGQSILDDLESRLPSFLRFDMGNNPFYLTRATTDEELLAQVYAAEARETAKKLVQACELYARVLEASEDKSTTQVYIATEGDDLRDVAMKFYGTGSEWRRLLVYNGLSSSLLEAGQRVLIPATRGST